MKEKNAIELGFVPQYCQMTEEQTEMLMKVLFTKEKDINIPDDNIPFVLQILDKRIKAAKLPIKFSVKGKFAAMVLSSGNPGRIVTILIDCLTEYEGQTVTDEMICNIYPWGFYNNNSFFEYVEKYLKPRRVKWSQIY